MTNADIDTTLQAYLSLRHRKHLPECQILLFAWATHEPRQFELGKLLEVDLAALYRRPRVHVGPADSRRYILFAYVCLPQRILHFIAPEDGPSLPPVPPETMPPLLGMTSASTALTLRTDANTTDDGNILGKQMGSASPVLVLDKALVFDQDTAEDRLWYKIQLEGDLKVKVSGRDSVLGAGQICWIRGDGLEYVAAPWTFFRHQLIDFETKSASLSLNDRITKLRQWSESSRLYADVIIGSRPGIEYQDTRPFIAGEWQIAKDYETVRAPDGRLVELKHLLSGVDVLRRPENRHARMRGIDAGSNYGIVTWSGDLGAAAADMRLHRAEVWELRNPGVSDATTRRSLLHDASGGIQSPQRCGRLGHRRVALVQAGKHVSHHRFVACVLLRKHRPGWTAHADRGPEGRPRTVSSALRFHVPSTTETLPTIPCFQNRRTRLIGCGTEIGAFANAWFYRRAMRPILSVPPVMNPLELPWTEKDASKVQKDVDAMTELFLYWLELAAIENGAEVAAPGNRFQGAQSTLPAPAVTPAAVHDSYNDSSTGGQASTADIAVIQKAKSQADLWLTAVIKTLEAHRDAPDPKIGNLVRAFFKTQSQDDLETILKSYRSIQANLDGGITYEIDKTGKFWGRTGGYSTRASTLGENFFEATTILDEQAGTLIHEAAHRHVSPGLTGFRSKFETYCYDLYAHDDPDNSPKAWNKLETSDLMTTPDIYAAFAAAMNDGYYLGFWGCMPRPLRNKLKVGPP